MFTDETPNFTPVNEGMYTVQYTLYNVQCTICNIQCNILLFFTELILLKSLVIKNCLLPILYVYTQLLFIFRLHQKFLLPSCNYVIRE